ncbi:MAG: amidohydrolase family protein [Acidimicrobiia bacterium]
MPTRPYLFSCDAHIAEPPDLFTSAMTGDLAQWAIHGEKTEKGRQTMIGDRVIHRIIADFHTHKTGISDAAAEDAAPQVDRTRRGARDLKLRLEDMDRDGVDAELCFPSLGLMLPRIEDPDAQRIACEIYNDWAWDYCQQAPDRLVPAAMIPCIDLDMAYAECVRTADKGYAAFCLWEGLGNYNQPIWDPIFALAEAKGIPLVFHTGTGNINIKAIGNPGGALYNYVRQMNDAVDVITLLVSGGVLDRHPNAHVVFAEHSAGWLWGLAERMDEGYLNHGPSVTPRLSRLPSQIVRDQVHCALQNDIGSVATRRGVGIDALMFATDYPHSEGTFPFSQSVVDRMMTENPDATFDEFVAILGGTAAKLFKRANLQPQVDARTWELQSL